MVCPPLSTYFPNKFTSVPSASQPAVDHHPLALRLLVPEDPSTAAVGVEGPGPSP
jgi:hypothetical protein